MKRLCGVAHWEIMKGTSAQAINYCTKVDTRIDGPWETGINPVKNAGKRTDLLNLTEDIKNSVPTSQIFDSHGPVLLRYPRGFQLLSAHYLKRSLTKWRTVTVTVYWGLTGVGKTRKVNQKEPILYVPDLASKGATQWWDGYDGEEAILLDEFYGQVPPSLMLRLLDGYSMQLPVKGAFTYAQWLRVYITSNCHPKEWWVHQYAFNGQNLSTSKVPQTVRDALMRRITKIKELK